MWRYSPNMHINTQISNYMLFSILLFFGFVLGKYTTTKFLFVGLNCCIGFTILVIVYCLCLNGEYDFLLNPIYLPLFDNYGDLSWKDTFTNYMDSDPNPNPNNPNNPGQERGWTLTSPGGTNIPVPNVSWDRIAGLFGFGATVGAASRVAAVVPGGFIPKIGTFGTVASLSVLLFKGFQYTRIQSRNVAVDPNPERPHQAALFDYDTVLDFMNSTSLDSLLYGLIPHWLQSMIQDRIPMEGLESLTGIELHHAQYNLAILYMFVVFICMAYSLFFLAVFYYLPFMVERIHLPNPLKWIAFRLLRVRTFALYAWLFFFGLCFVYMGLSIHNLLTHTLPL